MSETEIFEEVGLTDEQVPAQQRVNRTDLRGTMDEEMLMFGR